MIMLLPAMTAAALIYLFRRGKIGRIIFAVLLAGTAAASVMVFSEFREGEMLPVSELPADAGAGSGGTVPLIVETDDGGTARIPIRVTSNDPAAEDTARHLEKQAAELDRLILGKNSSLDHIEYDLALPYTLADEETAVIWTSDMPDVISSTGVIGSAAAADGTYVTLTARLSMNGQELEVKRRVRVFPSKEEAAVAERLQEAADGINRDRSEGPYLLPGELDGRRLTWYLQNDKSGTYLCLLIVFATVLAAASRRQREEDRRKRRQEELRRSYPDMVSKIHLLLTAGLSLRKVIERLASEYRRGKKRTGAGSALGEELLRACYDLESGMPEQDVFTALGDRCGIPEYKGLALMLSQNVSHGGHRLPQLLEAEVTRAFGERKRQARIAGEKAAIRLTVPMGMMLVVVLVFILVPAMLSF